MGLFNKLFQKEDKADSGSKTPKGFHQLTVQDVKRLTADCVQLIFDVPAELKANYAFVPGQYIDVCVYPDGTEQRRSYSICSGADEALSVAIKAVNPGQVSQWANQQLKAGDTILVSEPHGNFTWNSSMKHVVAFAAGSGITPILSIAKAVQQSAASMQLFYASKNEANILFRTVLDGLTQVHKHYYLSQEEKEGFAHGRITKEAASAALKTDLSLLKADAFFICGPEEMITGIRDLLHLFGVPKEKIHFELFTTPVNQTPAPVTSDFNGVSNVQVILDDEKINFQLKADGKTILETIVDMGYDAPYSCRGGVCCTCKAKITSGSASMTLNYSLTDQEVAEGYVLTCQAHPTSEKIVINYDV